MARREASEAEVVVNVAETVGGFVVGFLSAMVLIHMTTRKR